MYVHRQDQESPLHMWTRTIFLLLMLVVSAPSIAQDDAPAHIGLGYAYLGGGAFFAGDEMLYSDDIARITPGSVLLAGDLSGYEYYTDPFGTQATGLFALGMTLYPCKAARGTGPELRTGLLYGGRSYSSGYFRRVDTTPYDTLTSSQTGEEYYIDSVHTRAIYVDQSAERFGLDVSAVWRTTGRWSIHGGAGLAIGVLMNIRTNVYFSEYSGTGRRSGQGNQATGYPGGGYYQYYGYDKYSGVSETFQRGTGWWAALYVPVGVDFRMGRKGDFWTRAHMFCEFRPQLVFQATGDLEPTSGFGAQTVFGLRFKL